MRDKRNTKSVQLAVLEIERLILKFRDLARYSPEGAGSRLAKHTLLLTNIRFLNAAYSAGADLERIKGLTVRVIDDFETLFEYKRPFYRHIVDIVSIAIVVDVDIEDFERITKIIARDKVRDKLINFLVKYKQSDWADNSNQFIQKEPYEKLKRAIDEQGDEAGIREIRNYLKPTGWYDGNSHLPWYESHTFEEGNTYVGYWCWEAAALVKAKGWDDEKLKDNEYYPYDAVHW